MRVVGSVFVFVLLVFSAHWTILALNPGVAQARATSAAAAWARASVSTKDVK